MSLTIEKIIDNYNEVIKKIYRKREDIKGTEKRLDELENELKIILKDINKMPWSDTRKLKG